MVGASQDQLLTAARIDATIRVTLLGCVRRREAAQRCASAKVVAKTHHVVATPDRMTNLPRLYLSHDTQLDWLIALEFGRIDDAQPPDCWRGVSEQFGYLHDVPGGRVVGFKVVGFSVFDPEDEDHDEIWGEPRFDAPLLALSKASAGEIVVAARAHFDGRDSLNRRLFGAATNAEGEEAVVAWRHSVQSGDAMAHFGLGYPLF